MPALNSDASDLYSAYKHVIQRHMMRSENPQKLEQAFRFVANTSEGQLILDWLQANHAETLNHLVKIKDIDLLRQYQGTAQTLQELITRLTRTP